jgi:signal transduction histidine kinase
MANMLKYKYKITCIATLLGLAMWVADATLELIEKNLSHQPQSFFDLLILNISHEELIIRSLTLFSFIIFGFFLDRNVAKIEMSENKLKDSQNQLRMLTAELLNIQDGERRRISRELHDSLGQAMMLFHFQLSAIHENFKDKSLRHELEQVLGNLDDVIDNVRHLINDLSPASLENIGLSAAVGFLLEEFSKSLNIEASVDIEDVDHLLSPQVQLNIYRIFQEALTNVGKHAQAKHLSSVMKKQDKHIYLEIKDDGKGFDVDNILANLHKARKFGLGTINERARLIGGTLNLSSQKDSGTQITVTVPVDQGVTDGPLSHFAGR